MREKCVYRCQHCGKVLFCVLSDGAIEIKRGEQVIKFINSRFSMEVLCGRCKTKNTYIFSEDVYAKR